MVHELMDFKNKKEKFNYENNRRLDGELLEASWLINQFAYALAPIRPVMDDEVLSTIHSIPVKDLLKDFNTENFSQELLSWINLSKRVRLRGVAQSHVTLVPGVDYSMESLIQRSEKIGFLSETYYGVREMCEQKGKPFYFLDDEILPNTTVILELPTPNHNVKDVLKFISRCKENNCVIALDFTYLPVITESCEVDLAEVDEFWFSMNKTWPISEIRPSLRFSKSFVNDVHSYAQKKQVHNRMAGNLLEVCIKKFTFDHTYDKFSADADSIIKKFNLDKSNNLWLGKKENVYWSHMPTNYWNYHNFIGLPALIENKGKYFW